MKQVLIILSIVFFTACAGTKKVITETKQKIQLLTVTDEIKLDTTILISGEKVSLFIPTSQVSQPKIYKQKRGRSNVIVKIDSSGITATSNCDSISKRFSFYRKRVKELRIEVNEMKTEVSEKKGYSRFELILHILVTVIVSFAAAYLLIKLKFI